MIRLVLLVLFVLVIAASGWWLASQTGLVVINAFNREISLSLAVGIAGFLLLTLILFLFWYGIANLVALPKKLRKMHQAARRERGYDALERALIASAAGDTKNARQYAEKLRDLMDRPALSGLLAARAAQADGDVVGAERHFETLLEDKRTRLAARRGLTETALQRHDSSAAITHAREAFAADPDAKWAFETLFDALVAAHKWEEAIEALGRGEKKNHVSKLAASRRRAVLLAAEASQAEINNDVETARKLAEKAVSTAPGFAPGAALAARLLVEAGKNWRAAGLLEDAWAGAPHPALSLAYGDLKENETTKARIKRLGGLAQINPDHRESKILRVELALLGEDPKQASQLLDEILADDDEPSSRICSLYAQSERQAGNNTRANEWLRKSLSAPDEADWSDLDPDGPAFGYRAEDWARLVYSFGDAGELIHPRHERFERVNHAGEHLIQIEDDRSAEPEPESEPEAEIKPEPEPEAESEPAPKPKRAKSTRTRTKTSTKTGGKTKPKTRKPAPKTKSKLKLTSVDELPRQPDDPGPGAKADPADSVLTRKRNVH